MFYFDFSDPEYPAKFSSGWMTPYGRTGLFEPAAVGNADGEGGLVVVTRGEDAVSIFPFNGDLTDREPVHTC